MGAGTVRDECHWYARFEEPAACCALILVSLRTTAEIVGKVARKMETAAETFMRAAEQFEIVKSAHEAARAYVEAAKCRKEVDPGSAIDPYSKVGYASRAHEIVDRQTCSIVRTRYTLAPVNGCCVLWKALLREWYCQIVTAKDDYRITRRTIIGENDAALQSVPGHSVGQLDRLVLFNWMTRWIRSLGRSWVMHVSIF